MAQTRDPITGHLFEDGAAHTAIKDSMLGPEGAAAGEVITISGSSQNSAAITEGAVDVITDSTANIFIAIGPDATVAAVVDTGYRLASGVSYRFPISSGNVVAVIGSAVNGSIWIHPVT